MQNVLNMREYGLVSVCCFYVSNGAALFIAFLPHQ